MAEAKIVVLYPPPADLAAFEGAYSEQHLPMAREGLVGATRLVLAKSVGAPDGSPRFHRIAEVYYDSMEALQQSLGTQSTQEVAKHAVSISNGGPPVFLICEEEVVTLEHAPATR